MNSSNYPKNWFLLILLILPKSLLGQGSNEQLIPDVLPPSPSVAQLGEFGSYPVSHFTGLANIQIPLHEIVVGDIRVPITLKYHSAGIKVTERATRVGLGWALQAGGVISRQVMGMADEVTGGYFNSTTIKAPPIEKFLETDLLYLNLVNRGMTFDVEPDIYSYSIGDMSGKFVFNQGENYAQVFIPYNPIRILKTNSENNLTFEAFDTFGANYKFDQVFETSEDIDDFVSTRSAWKLSQIISRDKQEMISFQYNPRYGQTYHGETDIITVDDMVNNPPGSNYYSSNLGNAISITHGIWSTEQNLDTIVFPLGMIAFTESSADREDGYSGQKKLDQITVFRKGSSPGSYTLLKTINFSHSYFISPGPSGDKRLKLDSVDILDRNDNVVQHYAFDYNTTLLLPDYDSKEWDYWGYHNNRPDNTLVPRTTIDWQSSLVTSPTTITIGRGDI